MHTYIPHTSIAALRHAVWAACGAMTLLSVGAVAQTPPESEATLEPSATPDAPATQAVPDKKVDQFAAAYIAVQEIQVQASQQLGATTDVAKADLVKQTAEAQMIKAVERSGLQIEEFNRIVQAMASDTTLRSRVSDRIGERKRTS